MTKPQKRMCLLIKQVILTVIRTQNIYQKKKIAVIQTKMRKLAVLEVNIQY
jgi:hypothetical protein